jgi:hypothetical protein
MSLIAVLAFLLSLPFSTFAQECAARFGQLGNPQICVNGANASIQVEPTVPAVVPNDYKLLYILTKGPKLVIQAVSPFPFFKVKADSLYTIHTLVYNPKTLDLSIVVPGKTTGVDVNKLLIQGGGKICAVLDVKGAKFSFGACADPCFAKAGRLRPVGEACLDNGMAQLLAEIQENSVIPDSFKTLYVLTRSDSLVIVQVGNAPTFKVTRAADYTIHTLIYDPKTLNLGIVQLGKTTGFDVNKLLVQGGGSVCAALDVPGAKFKVGVCKCEATFGILRPQGDPCLENGMAEIRAGHAQRPFVPQGYQVRYVLTRSDSLVIIGVSETPVFKVTRAARYRIHTLVYNPATLNLGIVQLGKTTGVDVNKLLIQGGGTICAALDVAGARFDIAACPCRATAGTLNAQTNGCFEAGKALLIAGITARPFVPEGYQLLYVLTSGNGLVIEQVNARPNFTVEKTGLYTIHTLVYDPKTLDLKIVQFGKTTGVDVNKLLIQGGGNICGALDVAGAKFTIAQCPCTATAGTLRNNPADCLNPGGLVRLRAVYSLYPNIPLGFQRIFVLTSGANLVIEQVNTQADFFVKKTGRFTIHTLVYNPATLNLDIVKLGQTTGVDVNKLLVQGGGTICGALDVAGAPSDVVSCPCSAKAGTLTAVKPECSNGRAHLEAKEGTAPVVPSGYLKLFVLTRGDGLVIEQVSVSPRFTVNGLGRYTIHTLVYNPFSLNLGIVKLGQTTGVDVNKLLIQGGGTICGALDVAGAVFDVKKCGSSTSSFIDINSSIFPNPTTNEINLLISPQAPENQSIRVEVMDLNGKIHSLSVLAPGTTQSQLQVAELPAGMYVVKLTYGGSTNTEMLRFSKL